MRRVKESVQAGANVRGKIQSPPRNSLNKLSKSLTKEVFSLISSGLDPAARANSARPVDDMSTEDRPGPDQASA